MKRMLLVGAVLLIAGPAVAAELVSFGPKADLQISVVSKRGVNTQKASAKLAYNAKTISDICMKVDGTTGPGCYLKGHPEPPDPSVRRTITANCVTGEFTPADGGPVTFMGKDTTPDSPFNYQLMRDGEPLVYPAHYIALSAFKALCPARAPLPAERRLNGLQ